MRNSYSKILFFCFSSFLLLGCQQEKSSKKTSSPATKSADRNLPTRVPFSPSSPEAEPTSSETVTQPQLRGPKQKHPALVTQPEQPNPIATRLKHVIESADGDVTFLAKSFTGLWNEGIAELPTKPLLSSNNVEVANGTMLPNEIEPVLKRNTVLTDGDTAEALVCGVGIWSSLMCNDLLAKFARQRADALPPTTADIVIYQALNTAIHELTQTRGPDSYASFEAWEPFANVANPIYRLLALRAAPYTVSRAAWNVSSESDEFNRVDAPAKLRFYLGYLDEKDPVILTEAIRSLANLPLPEARQAIEIFHEQQLELGDVALIQAAEDGLRTQKLISKGTK